MDMSNATPRYTVIPRQYWLNFKNGATASLYGAIPWTREADKSNWQVVSVGFTVRDNVRGTVGICRKPWDTEAEAHVWADAENARLAAIMLRYEQEKKLLKG